METCWLVRSRSLFYSDRTWYGTLERRIRPEDGPLEARGREGPSDGLSGTTETAMHPLDAEYERAPEKPLSTVTWSCLHS